MDLDEEGMQDALERARANGGADVFGVLGEPRPHDEMALPEMDPGAPMPPPEPVRLRSPVQQPPTRGGGQEGGPSLLSAEPRAVSSAPADWKSLGNRLAAEPERAQGLDWKQLADRLRNAQQRAQMSRSAEQMFANVAPGYRTDPGRFESQVAMARAPLELAKERQAFERRELDTLGAKAKSAATAAESDPNSLQSQKAREVLKSMFPGTSLPDNMSAADIKRFADTGDLGRLEASRTAAKNAAADDQRRVAEGEAKRLAAAKDDAAWRAGIEASDMYGDLVKTLKKAGVWDTLGKAEGQNLIRGVESQKNRGASIEAAERGRSFTVGQEERKVAREATEDMPPGFELVPGANPGKDSRKKFTALVTSQQKLKGLTAQMRAESQGADAADKMLPGAKRDRLNQLATQIGIEAKNVAELGALSGPDMDLMNAMVKNPTSAWNLLADTGANMDGLDKWADESVMAGGKSYGIRKAGGAGAAGGKIRVRRKSDGKTGSLMPGDFDPDKYERL